MKVAVLFSGGKDSCLALHKAIQEGHKIICLISILPINKDSFMFHKPDLKLLKKQAEMLNLPLIVRKSRGEKDRELVDLEFLFQQVHEKVDGIVAGGLASNYQGDRLKKLCEKYSMNLILPLWGYSPDKLWNELLENKFKIILTKISCEGIPKDYLGKVIEKEDYEKLKILSKKHKFRLDFEGGEAESSVLYMPEFRKELKIEYEVKSEDKYRHFLKNLKILDGVQK